MYDADQKSLLEIQSVRANSTILITTVFPGSEIFHSGFRKSIEIQKSSFDILVLNDGMNGDPLTFDGRATTTLNPKNLTVPEIRWHGLVWARHNNYANVVFADIDDTFSTQKISLFDLALSRGVDFVWGDLDLTTLGKKKMPITDVIRGLNFPETLGGGIGPLVSRNFLGLTNTALRVSSMPTTTPPKNLPAFDWWLFTQMILEGRKGHFVEGANTLYFQGETLFFGPHSCSQSHEILLKGIKKAIGVKKAHYKNFVQYCDQIQNVNDGALFRLALQGIVELESRLNQIDSKPEEFVAKITKNWNKISPGWWAWAISPAELNNLCLNL